MAVELMCQHAPHLVLRHLEDHDEYALDAYSKPAAPTLALTLDPTWTRESVLS
jgi:hypothetical protein